MGRRFAINWDQLRPHSLSETRAVVRALDAARCALNAEDPSERVGVQLLQRLRRMAEAELRQAQGAKGDK
jgi:hypothetical protein